MNKEGGVVDPKRKREKISRIWDGIWITWGFTSVPESRQTDSHESNVTQFLPPTHIWDQLELIGRSKWGWFIKLIEMDMK